MTRDSRRGATGTSFIAATLSVTVIAFCVAVTLAAGVLGVPHEDSAILYSYAHNLATTGSISYFTGGPRAEGATDFGWMILIALGETLGLPNHLAAAVLNVAALLLVSLRIASLRDARNSLSLTLQATSIYVVILFATGASISGLWGFSTIASASLLACIFLSLATCRLDLLFLFCSTLFVLLRPDGMLYYLALVLGFFVLRLAISRLAFGSLLAGWQTLVPTVKASGHRFYLYQVLPIAVFGVYWLWRMSYFASPFPLPFYVKQRMSQDPVGLVLEALFDLVDNEFNNIAVLVGLLCALAISYSEGPLSPARSNLANLDPRDVDGLRADSRTRFILGHAVLAGAVFMSVQGLYLSMYRLMQNIDDRFHVPGIAIAGALAVLTYVLLAERPARSARWNRSATVAIYLLIFVVSLVGVRGLGPTLGAYGRIFKEPHSNNMIPLAKELARIHQSVGVERMLVTEAGRLSYYSGIPTVDAWGLNTREFAKSPLQDPGLVEAYKPDLISMHANLSSLRFGWISPASLAIGRDCNKALIVFGEEYCGWHEMSQALYSGARMQGYESYVVPFEKSSDDRYDLFLVRPQAKAHDQIVRALLEAGGVRISEEADLRQYKHGR